MPRMDRRRAVSPKPSVWISIAPTAAPRALLWSRAAIVVRTLARRRSALLCLRRDQIRRCHRVAGANRRGGRHHAAVRLARAIRARLGDGGGAPGRVMKIALVNPNWSFDGSIYFGCREPHLPLEYGYAKILLDQAGHEAALFDAQLDELDLDTLRRAVAHFA